MRNVVDKGNSPIEWPQRRNTSRFANVEIKFPANSTLQNVPYSSPKHLGFVIDNYNRSLVPKITGNNFYRDPSNFQITTEFKISTDDRFSTGCHV